MLNSKLQHLKDHFGVTNPEDWQAVAPAWILGTDGCGPKTLDYLRLLLAARGLTLKDDRTPEYWQQHLREVQISDTLGNELISDDVDRGIVCPFTVLIDTAEQSPFTFQGFRTDGGEASGGGKPLVVPTEFRALDRYRDGVGGLGDYSLDCGMGRCHVERKSMEDAHSTILGWAKKGEDVGRRDRFEQELERLSDIEAGLVVVECSFSDLIRLAPQYGRRSASLNSKTLFRSVLAWQQRYAAAWMFCDGRRLAEQYTFRWLEKWYCEDQERRKAEERRIKKLNGNGVGQVVATEKPADKPAADVEAELAAL